MRCIKAFFIIALFPSLVWAASRVEPVANPPEPVVSLSAAGIPFIKASSGTMGNNGAISAMTALPRIFSGGAYLYLPANAISAGSAAGWYWFVGSSTTAGTVYNSTYTSGTPTRGTATAFSTTGPGAYTGATAAITAISITVPANSMGLNGTVEIRGGFSGNNSGGTKLLTETFGGATVFSYSLATALNSGFTGMVQNRASTSSQGFSYLALWTTSGFGGNAAVDGAVDTTANVTLTLTITTSGSTDHGIIDHYRILTYQSN